MDEETESLETEVLEELEENPAPQVKVEKAKKAPAKSGKAHAKGKAKTTGERSSWRCQEIPDQAFMKLGSDTGNADDWQENAVDFIVEWADRCPNYAALEKEFPPFLMKKKYSDKMAVLFELNRHERPEPLFLLARQDEYDRFVAQNEGKKKSTAAKKEYLEKRQLFAARANGAQLLLERKYPKLMKQRAEAYAIVNRFLREYQTSNGEVREENTASLKAFLKGLNVDQKKVTREYLREALRGREYPKTHLTKAKGDRAPASTPSSPTAAVQIMLWELQ